MRQILNGLKKQINTIATFRKESGYVYYLLYHSTHYVIVI